MERNLLRKDKRGISLVVSYALLILIAISVSTLVFYYLKLYLPEEKPDCREDVSLIIESASCSSGAVDVNIVNRGLFSVDSVQIRIGDKGRVFKETLKDGINDFGFRDSGGNLLEKLPPGALASFSYNYAKTGEKEIEIQPIVVIDGEYVLCDAAIVDLEVSC